MIQIFNGRCNIICIIILEIFGRPQIYRCRKNGYSPTHVFPLDILLSQKRSASSISTLTSKVRKTWSVGKTSLVNVGLSLDTAQRLYQSKTNTRMVQPINSTQRPCERMQLLKNKPSIATNFGTGRLGNQMCNFASLYALHMKFGELMCFKNYTYELLQNASNLPNPMQNTLGYSIWNLACVEPDEVEFAYISNMQMLTDTDRKFIFEQVKFSYYIYVSYICDIKGFIPYLMEVRKQFL